MTSNPCFFFSMQLKLALNPVKHSTSRESGGGGGGGGLGKMSAPSALDLSVEVLLRVTDVK